MNLHNTKHEEFLTVINTLKALSSTITDEQRKGLLQQAVQQYGFSIDEAKDLLISSGLAVRENINFFDILELSIEEIQNQSNSEINTLVHQAHERLYGASLRAGGLPRADGKTQEQWRTVLNQARDLLLNQQKRLEHISTIQNGAWETGTPIWEEVLSIPEQDDIPEHDPTALSTSIPDDMVLIPAGEFLMGSKNENADGREKPAHSVFIDAFCIDKFPVTNRQYKKFIDANTHWRKPSKENQRNKTRQIMNSILRKYHGGNYLNDWVENDFPIGKDDHPVTHISWFAAMAYAEWVGKRLPTEAEWEKAARGGVAAQRYPWGDVLNSTYAECGKEVGETYPVGKYPANDYGVHDIVGNVWEWCLDLYDEDLDLLISDYLNVTSDRVLRGGTQLISTEPIHIEAREVRNPKYTIVMPSSYHTKFIANIGFRCVDDARFKSN